jgi:hypothetical protein
MIHQSVGGLAIRSRVLNIGSAIGRKTGSHFTADRALGTFYQAPHPVIVLISDIPMDRKSDGLPERRFRLSQPNPNQRVICARA